MFLLFLKKKNKYKKNFVYYVPNARQEKPYNRTIIVIKVPENLFSSWTRFLDII